MYLQKADIGAVNHDFVLMKKERLLIHGGEIYDKKIEYDFSVNLNPVPCPEAVMKALTESVPGVGRYPDIEQRRFREAVAQAENKLSGLECLTKENIIGGNGASELLLAIIRYIAPKNVLLPVPSFYGYRHGLNSLDQVAVKEYLLSQEDGFRLTDKLTSQITYDTDLLILANPNNPTGRAIDVAVLEHIIDRCKETGTWIIIDECFLHLTDGAESAVKFICEMPRLFIVNAYTKLFSLPGVRIGYAISDSNNINKLKRFLPEWNMSVFAQNTGCACAKCILENDFVKTSKSTVKELRIGISQLFKEAGYRVIKSDSCFVLIKADTDLYRLFLEKQILIRDCSNFAGLGDGYYRLSVSACQKRELLKEIISTDKDMT